MKKSYIAVLFLAAAACAPVKKKEYISGIVRENMDLSVDPGNDFFTYINGSWIARTEIPADKSSYGIFTILYEKSEENVKAIIEESAEGDFEYGSDEQKVGDLYHSYMDMEKRNETGVAPLMEEFARIDAISGYEDLSAYFAYANKNRFKVPFNLLVYPDMKKPDEYAVYLWQAGLGLPEREYYLKDDERSAEIRAAYKAHIEKMFDLAGIPGGDLYAAEILQLETRIAEQHLEKEETRNLDKLYNMVPVENLPEIMPDFHWDRFLAEAGIGDLDQIGILMMDYARALNGIMTTTGLDTWKTYLKWGVLNAVAGQLTEELDQQDFDFYQKELLGVEEQRPMWRRGTTVVSASLGEVIGKVYVKRHFPPEAKERMETLVENLLGAYDASIRELDWMSEETREKALEKLGKFTYKIGYPNKWRDYSALVIERDDLYGNLQNARLFEYNRNISKLGKPIDREEWNMTPQTVNAYYNPTMNEVVFPAAILQPPFFNMEADDAVNYGAIGAVIGHEIGHGFDDQGSKFDGDGAMRNWWTESDRERFEERTGVLVAQYDEMEVLPGLYANGEYTLGENIGDLGGLSIALKAYKMSLGGEEGPVIDDFTANQRVFIGWAQAWNSKSRDEYLEMLVKTNPHSPPKLRVNGVVRNIPEFYAAFDVSEQDSLYLPPEQRVKIW
jgi:putative endopeptidase